MGDEGAGDHAGPAERVALALVVVTMLVVLVLSIQRHYFSFGEESDFLWTFLPEATRLQAGLPLYNAFHPPLYSMVLAWVEPVFDDWLITGLAVSFVSALVALLANLSLFRDLVGRTAEPWVIAGCLCSPVFLITASQASSDAFFLAMYSSALALAARGVHSGRVPFWVGAGLCAGLTGLIRMNGIIMIVLLAAPLLIRTATLRRRSVLVLCLAGAMATPIAGWWVVSQTSGAPFWPTDAGRVLGATYFSGDAPRLSLEAMNAVDDGRFGGALDVVRENPAHVARIYLEDLYRLVNGIPVLLGTPLRLVAFAGLLSLVFVYRARPFVALLVLTGLHAMLVNFKPFSPRYYMFLVPLLGVGIGALVSVLGARVSGATPGFRRARRVIAVSVCLAVCVSALEAGARAYVHGHTADREIGAAVQVLRGRVEPEDIVVARKPHLAYYLGARALDFPEVRSLAELRRSLRTSLGEPDPSAPEAGVIFLYVGSYERLMRPELAAELDLIPVPSWLRELEAPISTDAGGGGCRVFEVTPLAQP